MRPFLLAFALAFFVVGCSPRCGMPDHPDSPVGALDHRAHRHL